MSVSEEVFYGQNGEDRIICREFEGVSSGTFLDIGAYHPFRLSNTRKLYERGFKGVFVEPSPCLRPAFEEEYGADPAITILPVCVGARTGTARFWDSNGDAVSSLIAAETTKWTEAYGTKFTPIDVEIVTVRELLRRCPYQTFDFVNIDTEGNVWDIVFQFDFRLLGCKVVCLEWNGRDEELYTSRLARQGFKEIHRNGENLIFKKAK